MNIKSQQAKNSFLFIFIYLCSLSLQPAFATQSKEVITTDIWQPLPLYSNLSVKKLSTM